MTKRRRSDSRRAARNKKFLGTRHQGTKGQYSVIGWDDYPKS